MYVPCKRCGAPHDDGTAEYCFDCLDKIAEEKKEAPEGVQELRESLSEFKL